MGLFKSSKKDHEPQDQQAPPEPPSYDQLQQYHSNQPDEQVPQYSGNYGQYEYPEEKGSSSQNYSIQQSAHGQEFSNDVFTVPASTYQVAPQMVNIAYETDGQYTRPGYTEYLQRDQQRVAQGDFPKPREAFGRGGAPLSQGRQNNQRTGGGAFPGASKTTYHNAANK